MHFYVPTTTSKNVITSLPSSSSVISSDHLQVDMGMDECMLGIILDKAYRMHTSFAGLFLYVQTTSLFDCLHLSCPALPSLFSVILALWRAKDRVAKSLRTNGFHHSLKDVGLLFKCAQNRRVLAATFFLVFFFILKSNYFKYRVLWMHCWLLWPRVEDNFLFYRCFLVEGCGFFVKFKQDDFCGECVSLAAAGSAAIASANGRGLKNSSKNSSQNQQLLRPSINFFFQDTKVWNILFFSKKTEETPASLYFVIPNSEKHTYYYSHTPNFAPHNCQINFLLAMPNHQHSILFSSKFWFFSLPKSWPSNHQVSPDPWPTVTNWWSQFLWSQIIAMKFSRFRPLRQNRRQDDSGLCLVCGFSWSSSLLESVGFLIFLQGTLWWRWRSFCGFLYSTDFFIYNSHKSRKFTVLN